MSGPIDTVFIANRGEIACRIIRTCRAMGLSTVAVYAEPDAAAPHVLAADIAVPLEGRAASETYLDMAALVDAARRTGATAVHPGYGFLAENPDFAEACLSAGLTWIGPTPDSIRAMALKVPAKKLVGARGVPTLPSAQVDGDDEAAWMGQADVVGYPLLVKASAGGGGKGMRCVDRADELAEAVRAGRRESASSFGDPTVFLERLLVAPRHVEVQVLGDEHGNFVHLGDRDCSIQRRNQKVIEEAPAPGLGSAIREALHATALDVARAIDYVSAGTVEFLLAGDEFFFLEMNTRLQVEHPVTEAVCGVDIVRLQLEVAAGRPLRITQDDVVVRGHSIEARINAEDPARDYLPSVGVLHTCEFDTTALRVDSGVASGAVISPHYDSLLAKVIAHAATREEAIDVLADGLRRARLHGLATTRDAIVATITSEDFRSERVDTGFLERHPEVAAPALPSSVRVAHAVAAALASRCHGAARLELARAAPPGWRNVRGAPSPYALDVIGGGRVVVGLGGDCIDLDGEPLDCTVITVDEGAVDLVLDGIRRQMRVVTDGTRWWINDSGWQTEFVLDDPFVQRSASAAEGGLSSPLPGSVAAVLAKVGDTVDAAAVLVIIEAMKVEHRIRASVGGIVTAIHVAVGDRVDAHQVLAEVGTDPADGHTATPDPSTPTA